VRLACRFAICIQLVGNALRFNTFSLCLDSSLLVAFCLFCR